MVGVLHAAIVPTAFQRAVHRACRVGLDVELLRRVCADSGSRLPAAMGPKAYTLV